MSNILTTITGIYANDDFDDDDAVKLPADTLAILNEFLRNKAYNETRELQQAESVNSFEENWVRNKNLEVHNDVG